MSRIAVIGAGAWGTAIAIVLGRHGERCPCIRAKRNHVYRKSRTRQGRLYQLANPCFIFNDQEAHWTFDSCSCLLWLAASMFAVNQRRFHI